MCSCQRTQPAFEALENRIQVVGVTGVEPATLRLSSACSNQLSYTPLLEAQSVLWNPSLVELRRLELPTYSLQSYRSTN